MRIMAWYYKDGEQEIGPVNKAQLQQLIKTKKIGAKTLVRSVQSDQWRPLAELVRAKPQAAKSPAPPPPPVHEVRDSSGQPEESTAREFQAPPAVGLFRANEADNATRGTDADRETETPPTTVCSQCGRSFPRDQVVTFDDQVICAACKPLFVQKLREGATLPSMLEYGGFWIRFVAKFIDNIIMAIIQWAVLIPTSMMVAPSMVQNAEQFPTSGFFALMGFQVVLGISLPAAYSTFFIGRFGATLGKMACRLQVVTPEGGRVTYARALGRFFSEMISSMILAIGYIMAAFDDEKRALHDRICSTRVVRKA
jgi:uncharacterized RDD family membrane protein YckC